MREPKLIRVGWSDMREKETINWITNMAGSRIETASGNEVLPFAHAISSWMHCYVASRALTEQLRLHPWRRGRICRANGYE